MEENTRNYIELIDELRREYKIKVEDFCDEICNPRTYRRMLSGERIITHERIFQFCEKLKLSPSDFYYTASKRDRFELQKILALYQMIYSHDYSVFTEMLSKINRKKLISKQNEKFLDYCIIKSKYVRKIDNDDSIMKSLYSLSGYPSCLEKKTFDFVDVNILMLITEIQIKYYEYAGLDKLIDILNNKQNIITRSDTSRMFPTIYSNACLFLCRLKRYKDTLDVSTNGIAYSIEFNNMSSLAHLHYLRSHSLLQLGFKKDSEIEAAKCIASAIAKGNTEEIKVFFKELEFDHKINPIDLLKRHQDSI